MISIEIEEEEKESSFKLFKNKKKKALLPKNVTCKKITFSTLRKKNSFSYRGLNLTCNLKHVKGEVFFRKYPHVILKTEYSPTCNLKRVNGAVYFGIATQTSEAQPASANVTLS